MDQYASIFGKKGHLIKLDCASREHDYVPFAASDLRIVLFDTQVKHSLASSAYNRRREECEAGVGLVKEHHPGVSSLRDVSETMLRQYVKPHDETVYQRCSYVVGEMNRLQEACEHLEENNFRQFGQCMFETHYGLKNQYEVSCFELDLLVEMVETRPDVFGARMMGGGFGGCTINLVRAEAAESLAAEIAGIYHEATGMRLAAYFVSIEDGAGCVTASHA
ncbi:galactokinase [Anseongella ginsenosidimutans]|nr:hypothetical protein [Anseongella ginsenosidimutans]